MRVKRYLDLRKRLSLSKVATRVIRFWKAEAEFPSSSIAQEAKTVYTQCISHREIRNALLNAERRKAEAFMVQRRRVVC
jgi:hypothetical protein